MIDDEPCGDVLCISYLWTELQSQLFANGIVGNIQVRVAQIFFYNWRLHLLRRTK